MANRNEYITIEYITNAHFNAGKMEAILNGEQKGDIYNVPVIDKNIISAYAEELGWIYYRTEGEEWIEG